MEFSIWKNRRIIKTKRTKTKELSILEKIEVETLWDNDLNSFIEELDKYEKKEEEDRLIAKKLNKGKKSSITQKKRRGGGRKKKSELSDTSSINDVNSENNDTNNISLVSDTTAEITKNKTNKKKDKLH